MAAAYVAIDGIDNDTIAAALKEAGIPFTRPNNRVHVEDEYAAAEVLSALPGSRQVNIQTQKD